MRNGEGSRYPADSLQDAKTHSVKSSQTNMGGFQEDTRGMETTPGQSPPTRRTLWHWSGLISGLEDTDVL